MIMMISSKARAILAVSVEYLPFLRRIRFQTSCFSKTKLEVTPCHLQSQRSSSMAQSAQRPWTLAWKPMRSFCGHQGISDSATTSELCQRHDSVPSSYNSVSTVLKDITERFERADIPESAIAAEYIVAHALGKSQLSEFSRVDQRRLLSDVELEHISSLAEQKLLRVPLQYIVGEWEFRDLTLKMRPPVFIPRPETEMLVDLVVSHCREDKSWRFLEVGCGSGAISLSLLDEFHQAEVMAIEGSADAVALTLENAERLGLSGRLEVHHTFLTEGDIPEVIRASCKNFDAIVSNPPYVFSSDMDDLDPEIARYEDPRAVEAGPDGLSVIRDIIRHASHLLRPEGLIWLETDIRHHEMIREWLRQHPEMGVHFRRSFLDFSDRPRFCKLEYSPSGNLDCG